MGTVRESIEIGVPVRVAYRLLCRFENYPDFMTGVRSVAQVTRTKSHWVVDFGGVQAEFDTDVTERRPDELLSWHSVAGPRLAEKLTFQRLSDTRTRITAERYADTDVELDIGGGGESQPSTEAHLQELFNQQLTADLAGLKAYLESGTPKPTEPAEATTPWG